MKNLFCLLLMVFGASSCNAHQDFKSEIPYPTVSLVSPTGKTLKMYLINHGSIAFDYDGYKIQIDPVSSNYGKTVDYSAFSKADIILVTHEHGDHLNKEAISSLRKAGTRLYLNQASQAQINDGNIVKNGDKMMFTDKISAEVRPAYNTTPSNQKFHPKGNGNAYLFDFDGLKVFVSGDSEDIPEYSELKNKNIDVAFLSANQPYTMTPEQCVNAAKIINPKTLIPYHLGNTDTQKIVQGLADTQIEVKLFDTLK